MARTCGEDKEIKLFVTSITSGSSHRSNEDKMFAGIGRKLRMDVGGNDVCVKMGRLVERVCVEVVGCVLELTLA